jgi:hypothetical protein
MRSTTRVSSGGEEGVWAVTKLRNVQNNKARNEPLRANLMGLGT